MIARPRIQTRRRGQGTTEYVVLVGLIAILLVGAVLKFSNQIKITFIGTAGDLNQNTIAGQYGGQSATQAHAAGKTKTDDGKYNIEPDPNDPGGFIYSSTGN